MGYCAEALVRELRVKGAVCLPAFFDAQTVQDVSREALAVLAGRTHVKIRKQDHFRRRCPRASEVLNSILLRTVADKYDPKCEYLFDVVFNHHQIAGHQLSDIHFDMLRSLKFMVYLSDADQSSAAFRYCFGSHRTNRTFRNRFLAMGGKLEDLPNVPGRSEGPILTDLEGPRGTLIVFDTEGFHSAGTLQEGKQRLLLRGRTLLSESWFESKVLRRCAALYPLKFFASSLASADRGSTRGKARAT